MNTASEVMSETPGSSGRDGAGSQPKLRVAVIGAGAMGLAAGLKALQNGHDVTIFEADSVPGGMAAHFDFDGVSIERFYHFVCKSDADTFALMSELGIGDKMRWVSTKMGYFVDGRLHDWGNPVALLKFPGLSFAEKVRYGLMMLTAVRRKSATDLENITSHAWIESWCGKRVYDLLWRPLFELKFYDFADKISAAWIWTRIKRVGTSRKSMLEEQLGYIEGGSQTLIDALVEAINKKRGRVRIGQAVSRVVVRDKRVAGVEVNGDTLPFDAVISTVPIPYVVDLVPDLSESAKDVYRSIDNIGVVCVILKLKRPVTGNFWTNVSDSEARIPGFVEFSNLRPLPATIVYVPFYMPVERPEFGEPNEAFIRKSFACMQRINPQLAESDLIVGKVGRLKHAQPVCPPGFASTLPSVQTEIAGLQIADTCFYYPEDRGISESVRLGRAMADAVPSSITCEER